MSSELYLVNQDTDTIEGRGKANSVNSILKANIAAILEARLDAKEV